MADLRERLTAGAGPSAPPPDLDAVARGAHRRVRRARRARVGGAALLVAVLVGGGTLAVTRDDAPDPMVDVGPPPTVTDTTTSSLPTTSSTNASSETRTAASNTDSTSGAECTAEAILPAVQRDVETTFTAIDVAIDQCVGGYARVSATFDVPECVPGVACFEEGATVFLAATAEGWRVITWGSGITCLDSDIDRVPGLPEACAALGLS
jgi:hypothetical protein